MSRASRLGRRGRHHSRLALARHPRWPLETGQLLRAEQRFIAVSACARLVRADPDPPLYPTLHTIFAHLPTLDTELHSFFVHNHGGHIGTYVYGWLDLTVSHLIWNIAFLLGSLETKPRSRCCRHRKYRDLPRYL